MRNTEKWPRLSSWLPANLAGFALAGAMFHNFPLDYSPSPFLYRTPFNLAPAVLGFAFGFIPALLAGWAQRWALRAFWRLSRWWIVSVPLGMGAMHFLADGYEFAGDGTGFVLVGGLVIGLFQWRLLRPHFPSAGWWGFAASAGWLLGWLAGIAALSAIGYMDDSRGNAFGHGLLGVTSALGYSLGSGLLLGYTRPAAGPGRAVPRSTPQEMQ